MTSSATLRISRSRAGRSIRSSEPGVGAGETRGSPPRWAWRRRRSWPWPLLSVLFAVNSNRRLIESYRDLAAVDFSLARSACDRGDVRGGPVDGAVFRRREQGWRP